MDKVKIGFPIEYEDENNIVRYGLFLREPEIKELEKRLKEINKITDLKQQCKKQKEVIDKITDLIKQYGKYDGEKCTRGFQMWSADFNKILDMLKEVKKC